MKKRILPALLALCMVMSLLPTVFAEDPAGPEIGWDSTSKITGTASCKFVTEWEQPENTDEVDYYTDSWSKGIDPHGDGCGLTSGCTCGEVVTVTWTATVGGVGNPSMTKTETLYRFGDMCEKCLKNSTCNPCTGTSGCTAVIHDHKNEGDYDCPSKCHYDTKTGTVTVAVPEADTKICADCAKAASKNPCEGSGCTLVKGHTEKHRLTTCTQDTRCNATEGHDADCPKSCSNSNNRGTGETGLDGCTLTYGHAGNHNNKSCSNSADVPGCGAATHETSCPQFAACEVADCTLSAGHTASHTAEEGTTLACLGAKGDSRCGATTHIAGCPKFCACTDEGCTHNPGCPVCKAEANPVCECPVCLANPDAPASGEVTNNDGEAVDPSVPAEPVVPEVPAKAGDFTDIDAEDESQEWLVNAVQAVLDNGWMQGTGAGRFDAGTSASTGMVLTVVARMSGEEISGAGYAELARAWADENELTEGIDLESDTIARKDIILLLWRLAGKSGSEQELEFTDIEGIEGDSLTALKWAVEKGIVVGNGDGTVTPDGILSRGQLAALVARYADNVK